MKIFVKSFLIVLFFYAPAANGQFSIQKPVVEVFTGSWVQFGPDGFVVLDNLLAQYPDAIGVNIHEADAMSIADGDDVINFFNPSYPQAVINRTGDPISRNSWASITNGILITAASVTVSFDSVIYNQSTRALDIYLRAVFTGPVTGYLNFNCIIVEDSVVGVGSGYNQVNSYNSTPGHPYYGAGNPIIGLPHRYVARDYLGGAWGTSGIINNTVNFGDVFTHHYSTVLSSSYNENRISLVGLVCRNDGSAIDERPILNAEKYVSLFSPEADFTPSSNNICKEESIIYTNTSTGNPTSWSWTFQGGTPASSLIASPGPVTYAIPGNYTTTLVVSGINGTDTHSQQIVVDSVDTGVIQGELALTAHCAVATYQWLDCDNNYAVISGENNQVYALTHNGSFAVEVTEGNCTDTSDCFVVANFGIRTNESGEMVLFPNPSDGHFFMEMQEDGIVQIYNQLGMQVYESLLFKGSNQISSNIATGVYTVRVSCGSTIGNFRLMIE